MSTQPVTGNTRERMLTAMEDIWAKFRPTILRRIDTVEEAVVALLEGTLDEGLRRSAEREAHTLAGSVGTFGFSEASRIAREIEQAFGTLDALPASAAVELSEQVLQLRTELERPPRARIAAGAAPGTLSRVVLLVGAEPARVAELSTAASERRLQIHAVETAAEARDVAEQNRVDAALLEFSAHNRPEMLLLLDALQTREPAVPALVLDAEESFVSRLEVTRHGGKGLLPSGAPPAEVLGEVETLLRQATPNRATVLVLDDDPVVLSLVETALETEGLTVTALQQPMRFWDALQETEPDLLILDYEMPDVDGLEMCRLVRADPRWSHLPILFLTALNDADTTHQIFAAGADDLVHKPFSAPMLAVRVRNRLERTRLLRMQAETDPLTGLATRTKAEWMAERYLRLARRQKLPFSLALLSVDRFGVLNNRQGHAAGDEVLGRLAGVLRQTFRAEDVISRWKGDTFLVGMLSARQADSVNRLLVALETFRKEVFIGADGGTFRATFSGGAATFPDDGQDVRHLLQSAERALFAARASGRDQVLGIDNLQAVAGAERRVDVVLVEDDPALAALLQHALDTRGYRTRWIPDGAEAARLLLGPSAEVKARALLLDVDLPGLDGLTLLRRLGDNGVLNDTRAIVLTVRASEFETLQALELGAFDHVAKPFSVPVLMERIRRALHD